MTTTRMKVTETFCVELLTSQITDEEITRVIDELFARFDITPKEPA